MLEGFLLFFASYQNMTKILQLMDSRNSYKMFNKNVVCFEFYQVFDLDKSVDFYFKLELMCNLSFSFQVKVHGKT